MSIATDTDLRARLAGVADIGPAGLTVHDEAALRGPLMDDLVFEAVFNEDAGLRDAARWVIWSASQALGCGSASIHDLYRARGRGEVPATALHRAGDQRPCRRLPDRAPGLRRGPRARRGHRDLRDRQERDGLHRPATGRVHRRHPGRRPAQRLAHAGLPPGRSLPVQRHEVGIGPIGRARRAARPDARGGRGRLPERRHRLLDAGGPLAADGRRAAARQRREHRRADAPDPLAPARRRDDQRRRRDRRGREVELDRGGAARLPRRLPGPMRLDRADQQGQRPDRDEPRRGRPARRQRGRGEHRLRHAPTADARWRARSTAWPAASSTAPRPCPSRRSTSSRPTARPRSTSRPGSRTSSTTAAACPTSCAPRCWSGASRTAPTSASPARPRSSSSTRRARRRSARSSASCGRCPRRAPRRSATTCARSSACSSTSSGSPGRARSSSATSGRSPSRDPCRRRWAAAAHAAVTAGASVFEDDGSGE